jgi:diguanylate cyclase (GGDEF)-like protein/PAS domain S-box-containing protein
MDGGTSKIRDEAVLTALLVMAALYLAGRAILPLLGHDAVDAWRLAVGLPIFATAALLLVRRARAVPQLRAGWGLFAAGVAIYPLGTILAAAYGTPESAPPLAHAAWLGFYLCAYLALGALAHAALRPFPSAFLLDGVAVVLTIGSAASLAASIAGAAPYRVWEAAIGLSYPALDLILLGYTLWIMAVSPRPVARLWQRLAVAFGVLLTADLVFLGFGVAQDLSAIAFYTAAYPIVMVLLARAALAPAPPPAPIILDTRTAVAIPVATVVVLLGVLLVAAFQPVEGPALVLVALALTVLSARVVLIHRVVAQVAEARRFERGFDEAGIGMGITDLAGRWLRVNAALAELLGRPASELIGQDASAQVVGDHRAALRAVQAQLTYGAGAIEPVHLRVAVAGEHRDLLVTGDLVVAGDGPQCFVQVRDVTGERRARGHADAISAISRQALALDDLDELLGRTVPLLRAATRADLVAWIPLDGAGDPITATAGADALDERVLDDLRAGSSVLLGAREGRPVEITDPRALELGLPNLARRGLTHVAFTAVHPRAAGRAALCVAHQRPPERVADERTFLDIVANVLATAADRAHDERASRHRALHDPLTGLANRALLSAHLSQAIAAGRRDGGNVGALLIDLDRFKLVNDTPGHEIGDGLLRAVSDRLGRHTREGDLLARLGGDEFVLVVSRVGDPHDVERAAARIVAALEQPFEVGGRELCVGASTGVAILPASVATPEALLREADLAMYRAKRGGGARWSRADVAVRGKVEPRGDIERDLREAVAGDRLRLAFQPQLSLARRELIGFEALVRWARPGHGVLHPDAFVPLAATIGLLGEIGEWVLARALGFVGDLPSANGVEARAAVNLLPTQLTPSLPEAIDRISAICAVPASRLTLELPADTVVTDEAAMDVVERLRDRGIAVVLEGFGPGWTSLPALQRHTVDALKLDRTLIARLPDSAAARSVARSTVRIAEEFGIAVSAAGIETRAQLDAVRELGIDRVQGHLLSPPIGPGDAASYARARSWQALTAG